MRRAQLSLSAIEAGVGALFVLAVAMTFVVGVPTPDTREPQLDAYATDALAVLAGDPPRHAGATRLAEVSRSAAAFQREHTALDRRLGRILPDNLMYRLQTPHGSVGYRRPAGVPVGTAAVTTVGGDVRIWVWYV